MTTLKFTNTDLAKTITSRVKIFDTQIKGLYANKTPNVCTFVYRYWNVVKKGHDYAPVGTFHPKEFTVEHARRAARLLETDVKVHGKDVTKAIRREAVVAHNGTRTFNYVADAFIKRHKELIVVKGVEKLRHESWQRDVYSLKRCRAAWGTWAITDVTDLDVNALLKGIIAERKPEQVKHVLYVLTRLFRWAGGVDQKYITINPVAFINTKTLEVPPSNRKTRYLDDDELRAFWHGLDHPDLPADRHVAIALKLIIATALRPSEVGLALRSEIGNISKHQGGDGKLAYRIPANRVKKRRVIVQPLNSLAQELVNEVLADGIKDGGLFRCGVYKSKLTAHELGVQLRSQSPGGNRKNRRVGILEFLGFTKAKGQPFSPFTPHDLRRTATTHLGLAQVVSNEDKARILDHAPAQSKDAGGATLGVYDVSEHVQQTQRRRATLDALDTVLRGVIGPKPASKVVKLKKAA